MKKLKEGGWGGRLREGTMNMNTRKELKTLKKKKTEGNGEEWVGQQRT